MFDARYGDRASRRTVSTSVRPAAPYRTQSVMGRMSGSSQNVDGLRQMFDAFAQRRAAVMNSPLVLTRGLAYGGLSVLLFRADRQPLHSADAAEPPPRDEKQPEPAEVSKQLRKPAWRAARAPERQRGDRRPAFVAGCRSFRHALCGAVSARSQSGGYALPEGMLDEANGALRELAASRFDDLYLRACAAGRFTC